MNPTNFSVFIAILATAVNIHAQKDIPLVYNNIVDSQGGLIIQTREYTAFQYDFPGLYKLSAMTGITEGTDNGIRINFKDTVFAGKLYFGFIHYSDSKHPLPVYFRSAIPISEGIAEIDIRNTLSGMYDMIDWQKTGKGTLGYRVVNKEGQILYDGKVGFEGTGPFTIANTIIEGPFVNLLSHNSVTITFKTNNKIKAAILVNGIEYRDNRATVAHNIRVDDLKPDTEYKYTVCYEGIDQTYSFRTAPLPGSRKPFTFAYTSDSRTGQGGGERDVYGTNAYIMKKIMALAVKSDSRFLQFTGDMVNGYLNDMDEMNLQYANWKRSIEAFAHYIPVYVGMGNHEALLHTFYNPQDSTLIDIDRFPFETESSEAVFRANFTLPMNGPESEDGAYYDPDPEQTDFPSYKESVYYYIYDNMVMIVLNSDYLYCPNLPNYPRIGGNLHGYLLDKQLEWLGQTLNRLEKDENIDHIFVTQHTPAFPNGGHVSDDMWYNGTNDYRAYISGQAVGKGIIERRDEFLDLLVNKSSKVVAMLTGDEHNYNRMAITKDLPIYPQLYFSEKIELSRKIYQINNGAAGAPYYAQEETPWSEAVDGFTTQNALVLIHIEGKKIWMEVINPDTLELIDKTILKE